MGHHEEFIHSKKYSVEEIGEQILKTYEGIEPMLQEVDILCKATTITDINVDNKTFFGRRIEINPIIIRNGTEGLIVFCDNHKNPLELLPKSMREDVFSHPLDDIVLPQELIYEEIFEDSEVIISDQKFPVEQKEIEDLDECEKDQTKEEIELEELEV